MSKVNVSELSNNVTLCLIKNEKYKSNTISLHFIRPLKRDEVTKISLMMYLLTSGSMKYRKISDISKKMDSLYGMSINSGVLKVGERLTPYFKFSSISDRYVKESIMEETLDFIKEIVLNPLIVEGKLNPDMLEIEKFNLKDDIKSEINDKKTYALKKCVEIMCANEPFSINRNGYLDEIDAITSEELLNTYFELISSSKILITIEGDIDIDEVKTICEEKFVFEEKKISEICREDIDITPKEIKYITEDLNSNQGKLVIGCRTRVDYSNFKEYYSLVVANSIFGGGAHSKLFNNVREKESICYYASSITEKYKGLMFINSGIDAKHYDKALKLIRKEFEDMKLGNISELEIENAKRSVINGFRTSYDSKGGEADFKFTQFISGSSIEFEEVIEYILSTTKDDIVAVMNKVVEDTVYFLK